MTLSNGATAFRLTGRLTDAVLEGAGHAIEDDGAAAAAGGVAFRAPARTGIRESHLTISAVPWPYC